MGHVNVLMTSWAPVMASSTAQMGQRKDMLLTPMLMSSDLFIKAGLLVYPVGTLSLNRIFSVHQNTYEIRVLCFVALHYCLLYENHVASCLACLLMRSFYLYGFMFHYDENLWIFVCCC